MSIASGVINYLVAQHVDFDVVSHPRTVTSQETAQYSHVSGDNLAKSVVLEDDRGYLLAVLPASCRVDLGELHRLTNRNLGLATEFELGALFEDCETGAVPPLGSAYQLETIVDDSLAEQPDIYFESGDHEQLIHVSSEVFDALMSEAQVSHFSKHI
jgi:Ala-tRNA(Pro) deacylase